MTMLPSLGQLLCLRQVQHLVSVSLLESKTKASSLMRRTPAVCSSYANYVTLKKSMRCQLQTHLLSSKDHLRPLSLTKSRPFWGLDAAFNKVDEERVRLAGPDRACAEWVLRNGGTIKWTTSSDHLKDYNLLPTTDFQYYKLEEIDLSGTDVISMGFEHLEHLEHVKKVRLHGCRRIDDNSLVHLQFVKETLQDVEISWCPMVTVKGLKELVHLEKLEHALIYGLIEVKDLQGAVNELRRNMPWCKFSTEEPKNIEQDEKE